jgi:hypothetical protein
MSPLLAEKSASWFLFKCLTTTFSLLSSLVIYSMHKAFYFPRACCNFCHAAIFSTGFAKASMHCMWQFLLWNKTSCCTFIVYLFFLLWICSCFIYACVYEEGYKSYFSSELNCAKKLFSHQNGHSKAILFSILFLRNLLRIVLLTHFFKLFFC